MIDLKELQSDIDNLLKSITDDELVAWYESKTTMCVKSYIGEGSFFELPEPSSEVKDYILTPKCAIEIHSADNFDAGAYQYPNAA